MHTFQIVVRGRVQGVGFRYYTMTYAQKNKIQGSVRNCRDGSVLIIAQANESILQQFLDDLYHTVAPFAKVEKLEVQEIETQDIYHAFQIDEGDVL